VHKPNLLGELSNQNGRICKGFAQFPVLCVPVVGVGQSLSKFLETYIGAKQKQVNCYPVTERYSTILLLVKEDQERAHQVHEEAPPALGPGFSRMLRKAEPSFDIYDLILDRPVDLLL